MIESDGDLLVDDDDDLLDVVDLLGGGVLVLPLSETATTNDDEEKKDDDDENCETLERNPTPKTLGGHSKASDSPIQCTPGRVLRRFTLTMTPSKKNRKKIEALYFCNRTFDRFLNKNNNIIGWLT